MLMRFWGIGVIQDECVFVAVTVEAVLQEGDQDLGPKRQV